MDTSQLSESIATLLDNSVIQELSNSSFPLSVKRDDLIHPLISGNKLRKLKFNLLHAKQNNLGIITFGGAYSNHIAATAAACQLFGIPSIGIIRGEELTSTSNETLHTAAKNGMQLRFVSRSEYRLKDNAPSIKDFLTTHSNYFVVPEGGSNTFGIEGCKEILNAETNCFDIIAGSAGTATTALGIIEASAPHQEVWVFSSLKGDFLKQHIATHTTKTNWIFFSDYHFGGYAKTNNQLLQFIDHFQTQHKLLLDPIYNGKMMFGLNQLHQVGKLDPAKSILSIHTGGLQGWNGFSHQPVG